MWYHVDIRHVAKKRWNTYIREISLPSTGTTKVTAQENAVTLIVETTGDPSPKIVWNEC